MTTLSRQLERSRLPTRGAYLLVLLLATLSSLHVDLSGHDALAALWRMMHPSLSARDVVDGARNLVLFAGWGLVWMITAPAGRTLVSLRNAVLSGACVSSLVEGAQLFSSTRIASLVDILTNTVGAFLGGAVLIAAVIVVSRRRAHRSFVGLPALVFAGSYAISTLGEAFVPLFRQQAFPNAYGGAFGRFRLAVGMFEWSSLGHLPMTDVLLFAPAGAFAVAAMVEAGRGYRGSAWAVGLVGAVLVSLAEVGHAVMGLPIDAGAALAHALGVAGGAAVTAVGLPWLTRVLRGRDRPRGLLIAYLAVLLLWELRPFSPETSLGPVVAKLTNGWWIPLRFLAQRVDMFSVVDVVSPFFLYLPLGALLAVWPLRRHGPLSSFWPGVCFGMATEVAQVLVQGRLLDSTDLLVQVAGVVTGWVVLRRAGYVPHGSVMGR